MGVTKRGSFLGTMVCLAVGLFVSIPVFTSEDAAPTELALTASSDWIDTHDLEAVRALHSEAFGNPSSPVDWTGDHTTCTPGKASEILAQQTIARVNYYRAMAGVPAKIVLDPVFSAKAQYGAVSVSAEGRLTHKLSADFACANEYATEATANSNLYLGRVGPEAIDGYIQDPGESNKDVGHRNTVLHPPTLRMGVGHSDSAEGLYSANVLWVFDEQVFDPWDNVREEEGFVAWPPRGYVPPDVIYDRWSLTLPEADFSEAKVEMVEHSESVDVDVIERLSVTNQIPASTIVWHPQINPQSGQSYEVSVSNVTLKGEQRTFSYTVHVL